jgi:hypothetical protein
LFCYDAGVKRTLFLLAFSLFAVSQERELDWKTSKPLPAELVAIIRASLGSSNGTDDATIQKEVRTGEVRLNRRGGHGLVAQGFCSPTGNCAFWVFEGKNGSYSTLLEAPKSVQTFEFSAHETHGYRDLMTSMHGSAWYSELHFYRFDGRMYVLDHCAARDYQGENEKALKRPKITPLPC